MEVAFFDPVGPDEVEVAHAHGGGGLEDFFERLGAGQGAYQVDGGRLRRGGGVPGDFKSYIFGGDIGDLACGVSAVEQAQLDGIAVLGF